MAVAENQLISREDGIVGGGPVIADKTLYIGTMCFIDAATGLYTDIINGGANKFGGIVRDFADNAGGADAAVNVNVFERSSFILPLASAAQDDVGKKVYAVDNADVSLTATSQTYVGTITRLVDDAHVLVAIDVQLP